MKSYEGNKDLADRLQSVAPSGGPMVDWLTFVLEDPWTNIADHRPLQFHLGANGKIYIEGACQGGGVGDVIAYLPNGYRPKYKVRLKIAAGDVGHATVEVTPDGALTVIGVSV